jgi:5'-3' exonuclease
MSQQVERLPKGEAVCLIDGDSLIYYSMVKDTLEEAIQNLDERIQSILDACNTTKYVGFLTTGKCFRYDVYADYKAKRTKSNRSIFFYALKEYVQQTYKFTYHPYLEADDIVSYYSYTGKEKVIICSPDKDVLKQCVGMHYNYGKSEFVHTSPDEAIKFLWVQTLMGDSTDNIKGIPGVGIKTAENWLKDRTKDFEAFTLRKYVEYYGMVEGIHEFYKNFRLVYLLKTEDDMERVGVNQMSLKLLYEKSFVDVKSEEQDLWDDA